MALGDHLGDSAAPADDEHLLARSAADDGPRQTIRLGPFGEIRGRVVAAGTGRPIRGRLINAESYFGGADTLRPARPGVLEARDLDAEGRFRVGNVVPGLSYWARVVGGDGLLEDRWSRDLVLEPGESRDLGDIVVDATASK